MGAQRRRDRSDGLERRAPPSPALVQWIAVGLVAGCALPVDEAAAGTVIDLGIVAALVGVTGVVVAARAGATHRAWFAPPLLWLLAAASAGAAHRAAALHFDAPPALRAAIPAQPTLVSIDGWLAADPVISSPRRTTFPLESITDSRRRFDVEASAIPCALQAGDLVRVRGWLSADPPPRNPGELDASTWRIGRGVIGRVVVEDPGLVTPIRTRFDHAVGARAGDAGAARDMAGASIWNRIRAALARGLRHSLPDDTPAVVSDMLVAMNLGVTGSAMQPVRELFSRTGLSHFIVISGFHLAVLAATILLVAGWMGVRARLRGALVLAASLLFLLVLESQVSVLRAGLGGVVAGVSLLLDRKWPAPSILSLVAIVMLAVDPASAESPAFQLSFGAVAALLLLSPTVATMLERLSDAVLVRTVRARQPRSAHAASHPDGFARVLIGRLAMRPIAASLAAWIAVTPITLLHFGQCSPWAIPASVILSPLASAIALLGTVVALVGCWSPTLASAAGPLLGALGSLFLRAVETCASFPLATQFVPRPAWWWGCLTFAAPFIVVSTRRRSRRVAQGLVVLWIVIASMPFWPRTALAPSIVVLDLGLERCAVVRAGRSAILVDAGGSEGSSASGAVGAADARTIRRALLELGVTRLDAIVVTEHALRSMGAVESLLQTLPVERVLVVESMVEGAANTAPGRMLDAARACGVSVLALESGSTIELGHGPQRLELALTADDGPRPRRRMWVAVPDGTATPALDRSLQHGPYDDARAGVRGGSPTRGACRWRRSESGAWLSDRFDGREWRPTPSVE